jgi:ectoine hydroxylase-related dioxygenase (phytanoyl-CoA dioxygenase family)
MISRDDIQAFKTDGAICLRGLLSAAQIDLLKKGIDHNLAYPSPRAIVASQAHDPGFFIEDFCNWQSNAHYKQFILESNLAQVAAELTGSQTIRFYHDHMLTKEPGTVQRTPWHQDQPYYNVSGMQNVSMWISVDPVRRHSSLEFLAGSHLGPWLMPRTFMTQQAKWFPEGSLADLPDVELGRVNQPDQFKIVGWPVEPGDVVCFHMLTLHAAGPVDSDRRRRVFSVRFLGDDMRHAPRDWKTSPEFPNLHKELGAGAPMNHPLFPLLWPKTKNLA